MNMVTIPQRTYSELLKRQERTDSLIAKLQKQVSVLVQNQGEELRPEVAARIERRSQAIDAGKGRYLKTAREVKDYFAAL